MAGAVTPVFAFDERGQEWVVYPDDPAWPFIRVLYGRGVRALALPRTAFIQGVLTKITLPATMSRWDITKPAVGDMFRRLVRLQDCLKYLEGHPPEES